MRPLDKNLIVKQDDVITSSAGGIAINHMKLRQQKPDVGTVLYIGRKCKQVAIGDRVVFGKYAGINVDIKGQEYILFAETEIDATIPNSL